MTPGHDNAARGGWSSRQWGQGKHLTETERGKHTETDSYSLMYCSLFNTIHINNNNNTITLARGSQLLDWKKWKNLKCL